MSAPRRHSRKGGTAGAALARVRARRPAEAPAQGGAERVELQRWRDFAESAAEWFWETDARMRVSFVSDAFERQFGLPVSSVLGHRFRDYALVESSRNAEVWSYHDEVIA
ncbi:MAG TPA: PAS domain-containing protein, partial [Alphaproteobacteria bacterium]|nr:PAS domain-containing protein [Alphaproteobacteria bacterium]